MASAIVIGSGLGGLECGVILARHGFEVTVLEQERQIGGSLQTFVRKGSDGKTHSFDTGFHYVGGLEPAAIFVVQVFRADGTALEVPGQGLFR